MKWENLNRDWFFKRGTMMYMQALGSGGFGKKVHLPHDYMIEGDVKKDAPAGPAMGFFTDQAATYTKLLAIPAEWKGERVYVRFDGVMMNASVSVNGSLVKTHHYGYTPFVVDITKLLYYGEENRISVVVNPSMQPNSRWYSGAGIYRDVELAHAKPIHIENDGIFAYTKRIVSEAEAQVMVEVTVKNTLSEDHQVKVRAELQREDAASVIRDGVVLVKAGGSAVARIPMTVSAPVLWDADHPELYTVKASVEDMGSFGVRLNEREEDCVSDEAQTMFGIRTVTADAVHGLQVNGKTIKLKGGCIHHDNGLLGAVSLYDSEYRKLKRMKEAGYNAVRLAHNPPSRELLEVCDRIGLYVFDEAFDAWGFSKQPGDYSQFFEEHWKEDMAAFIIRDRNHPSILFWSTGNEVEERGGMANGYAIAGELADYVRSLDSTRLVTNGLCSMWSGLDDQGTKEQLKKMMEQMSGTLQNADLSKGESDWEDRTEAFCNCLDVVGYNYLDSHYEYAKERYPERVILGTESYPNQIDKVWDLVERLPYVIGDCTWTAYDYIGEAGIGKSAFFEKDDPRLKMGTMALSSHGSEYPWRLANDADFTINGELLPQGVYRKIVWGSDETGIFAQDPRYFGKEEIVSSWGWNQMSSTWNYEPHTGKPVKVYVYSRAKEVELFLNGTSLGKQPAGKANRFTAVFEVCYEPGTLTAVSLDDGVELSRASLVTTGAPAAIRLQPETNTICADGRSLSYVSVEIVDSNGLTVPDAQVQLRASLLGAEAESGEKAAQKMNPVMAAASAAMGGKLPEEDPKKVVFLAGFGSANPVTEDNYTSGNCVSYQGRAMAVIRAGYEARTVVLEVTSEELGSAQCDIAVTEK